MERIIDSGLSCFMIVANFYGISVTPEQISKLYVLEPEQKTGELEIIKAAKLLKMGARLHHFKIAKLKRVEVPLIAKDKKETFFIIAKSVNDKFMIMYADQAKPQIISKDKLSELWDGTVIMLSAKGVRNKETVFSFRWFIPTILKFKKEFLQVLLAVFTVQILGILTPVMTQVVVDKVLVHRSISTLNILAIGIAVVYIYMN